MVKTEAKLLGDLSGDLATFEKAVQEKVSMSGVAAMAKVMYDEAVHNASGVTNEGPGVKTGTLRDSIYRVYSPEKSGDDLKTYRVSWNKKKAPHGHLIEFGTSRAPAYPFIRPAFDRIHDAIQAGKERMSERLEEIKGEL